jgi:cobalt/nickel transport system permease protein
MNIEEFALGDSVVHRLDPRIKIIAAAVFSVVVALTSSIVACAVALVLPITLLCLARISFKDVFRRLLIVNGFILFLWAFLPFTYPGQVLYSIGPLNVHKEGLLYAALITLKSNAIHEEYHRLVDAIKVRGFKAGTNMHTYRTYAYLVGMLLVRSFDRSQRILAAMKCRGFRGKFYILHHYEMKRTDYMVASVSLIFSATLLVL